MEIAALEQKVQDIVDSLWPRESVDVKFYPAEDLKFGDIYSECLLELSRSTRRAPAELGAEILSKIEAVDDIDGELFVLHDYLNFLGANNSKWLESKEKFPVPIERPALWLPSLGDKFSAFTRMRFAVITLFQVAMLLRFSEKVSVVTEEDVVEVTAASFEQFFLDSMRALTSKKHQSSITNELTSKFLSIESSKMLVWLPSTTFSRTSFSKFIRSLEGKELTVINPPRGWCQEKREVLEGWNVARWLEQLGSKEHILNASMWYLASPLSASDLDPAVIRLNESNNIAWFSSYIRGRIERHQTQINGCEPRGAEAAPSYSQLERNLLIRLKFFEWMLCRAAYSGRIFGFISGLQELLSLVNKFWNNPKVRLGLGSGQMEPHQVLISTGVYRALELI